MNNNTPRSMTNPPPWANLDPRVLSPIRDKKKREAHWDDKFFRGNCLKRNVVGGGPKTITTLRKRPASAGVRRGQQEGTGGRNAGHGDGSNSRGGVNKLQRGVKSRPSSANVSGRGEAYPGGGSSTATARRDETNRFTAFAANGRRGSGADDIPDYHHACNSVGGGGLLRRKITNRVGSTNNNNDSAACSVEEREILAGGYRLNSRQEATFREFVAMLVDFDTCSTVHILDDAFREAQLATGLQDFTGCGAD